MKPTKTAPTKPVAATIPRSSNAAIPAAKEIDIEPAQAQHYTELEATVKAARENAEKIVQMAAQPLVATATSILLGKGIPANVQVIGIGGTKKKPTLRYLQSTK